jgi:hypothetical protein
MNGEPQSEQLQNFQERLNQWISDQGFWFQLRYAMVGMRSKRAVAYHTLRLTLRLAIFFVVISVGVFVYFMMRTGSKSYVADLNQSLKENFRAEKIEMRGFKHQNGEFYISRMAMLGGERTFYEDLEIRNLKCRMGLFDGLVNTWKPGLIEINKVTMELRAGSDSADSSKSIGDVIFQKLEGVEIEKIHVSEMSMLWGFSERTRGRILNSRLYLSRIEDGWNVILRGGTFSQNWLRDLDIVEIKASVQRGGITFEKAEFTKGVGSVTVKRLEIKSGERPGVSGELTLKNMEAGELMPVAVRGYVDGKMSGEFEVFGSTNSSDGVGFAGQVVLGAGDGLYLRDRLHILKALSVVDAFNTYRRVLFTEGNFGMRSHGGRLLLSDINVKTEKDLMSLSGSIVVRIPTPEEALMVSEEGEEVEATIVDETQLNDQDESISLREAVRASGDQEKAGFDKDPESLFQQVNMNTETRRIEELAAEEKARAFRYEGKIQMSLKRDAFARAPKLASIYPVSAEMQRLVLEVPLEGLLYDLTFEQADEIFKQGGRE